MDKYEAKLKELETCVYGTLVDRDPAEGIKKQKHSNDGWRSGASHPFKATKKLTFDVIKEYNGKTEKIELSPRTYANFEALKKVIGYKKLLETMELEKRGILAKLETEKDLPVHERLFLEGTLNKFEVVRPAVEQQLKEFQDAGYDVEV